MTEAMPFLQKAILLSYDPRPLAGALLAVEKVACATFLRLRRGQGAMQGNPCYARLFADLPYTPQGAFSCPFGTIHLVPPNPMKA